MRNLKVRIWDGKKYHYPEATKEESNHYLQFGSEGFWLYNGQGKMITASEVGGVCEEFTGLTDKNGKEIYENDLFKNKNYTYQVVFHQGAFMLKHLNKKNFLNLQFWGLLSDLIHYKQHYKDVFECTDLIGNIHENPELI